MSHLDRRAAVQTILIALLPRSMSETVKVQELETVLAETAALTDAEFLRELREQADRYLRTPRVIR